MDKSYTQWVQNLVKRYRQCQIKAAIKVNEEQLRFNWLLGHDIEEMRVGRRCHRTVEQRSEKRNASS